MDINIAVVGVKEKYYAILTSCTVMFGIYG